MKTCKLCGKPFQPRHNAQKYCDEIHHKLCTVCGEPFEISWATKQKRTCSKQCTEKLRERTMIERHGVPFAQQNSSIREKSEKTNLEKFGTKHAAQSDIIKEKTKKRFQEKYGVDWPVEASWFQEKSKETCLKKYGVEYTSQIPGRTKKMQQTNLLKYGGLAPMCDTEIHRKGTETRKLHIADDGTAVDSSYELLVYNFCLRNSLDFKYQSQTIEYEYQGKKHTTIIDFEIEGQLFEVKGVHLLEGCFDYAHVPIEAKLDVYKKNHVVVITDSSAKAMFGKPNSTVSNGLKYLHKCPEPLIGVDIALFDNPEFPYRDDRPKCFYAVKVDGQRSSIEAFQDETLRWNMIMNRIQYSGGFIDNKQVLNAMNITRTCKQPSWFSKGFAKSIIQKYCTSDIIVDPFAGWGTRAQAANELHKTYIGGDFNAELVYWHHSKGYTNIEYKDANNFKYDGECSVFICPPYSDPETGRCFEDYNFEGFDASAKALSQCQWLEIVMKNIPNAKEYIMVCKVVDVGWEQYIVDTKDNKSHFGQNNEYILVVRN